VIYARYIEATFSSHRRGLKTKLLLIPCRLIFVFNHDLGAHLLSGKTLILAEEADSK
jgi:hypothetical protein